MKSSRAACMETFRFKIFRMSVIFVHSTTNGYKKLNGLKIFIVKCLSSIMVNNLFLCFTLFIYDTKCMVKTTAHVVLFACHVIFLILAGFTFYFRGLFRDLPCLLLYFLRTFHRCFSNIHR